MIKYQRIDIGQIYFFVKDTYEWQYEFPINRKEEVGTKKLKNLKAFNEYSETILDVYEGYSIIIQWESKYVIKE